MISTVNRIRLFGLLFVFGIIGLIARLFFWQVIEASDLSRQAQLQYQRTSTTTTYRGSILATDGSFLTTDENDWVLFANKNDLKDSPIVVANELAPLLIQATNEGELKDETNSIKDVLSNNGAWLPIAHRVTT